MKGKQDIRNARTSYFARGVAREYAKWCKSVDWTQLQGELDVSKTELTSAKENLSHVKVEVTEEKSLVRNYEKFIRSTWAQENPGRIKEVDAIHESIAGEVDKILELLPGVDRRMHGREAWIPSETQKVKLREASGVELVDYDAESLYQVIEENLITKRKFVELEEKLRLEISDDEEKIRRLIDQITNLKRKVNVTEADRDHATQQAFDFQSQLEKLKATSREGSRKAKMMEDSLNDLLSVEKTKYSDIENKKHAVDAEVVKLRNDIQTSVGPHAEALQRMSQLNEDITSYKQNISRLEEKIKKKENEIIELQETNVDISLENDNLWMELNEETDQHKVNRLQHSRLRPTCTDTTKDHTKLFTCRDS